MFDLLKIIPAIQHLKRLSHIFNNKKSEIEMFCQYCDDATRKSNIQHGHLYLSIDNPVFHCFRCGASGTLPKLLIDTGFDDKETLKYISSFIKYRYISNSYWKKGSVKEDVYLNVLNSHNDCAKSKPEMYRQYYQYIIKRIGDVDSTKFLISPALNANVITCLFRNFEGKYITSRFTKGPIRYQKHSNERYFFQNININYDRVVIAEGPFDIINSYLYLPQFSNSFFISTMGTGYSNTVEYLVLRNMLIGEYEINIIFDNNLSNLKKLFWRSYQIIKIYNENITINGFLPTFGKDVSDCLQLVALE